MAPAVENTGPGLRYGAVLGVLAGRVSRGEMPPTAREVAAIAGYRSSRAGQKIFEELEADGLIERATAAANQRRPVRITERGWQAVGEGATPLLGRIAAGRGLEAVSYEEAYSLAGQLLTSRTGKRRYLLRVVGESMVDARIHDGDLLVVEEDVDPPEGSIVVALLAEDEVTVKRLYRHNGHVRLKAENPAYEDIVVKWGEVGIQGRVVAAIHNF